MNLDGQFITAMLGETGGYVYLGPVTERVQTDDSVRFHVVDDESLGWSMSKFRFLNVDTDELRQIVTEDSDILFLNKRFTADEFSSSDLWRESIVIRTPVLYFAAANVFERCWFRGSLARYQRARSQS